MTILTAKFKINPSHSIVVECKDIEIFSYALSEDEYSVSVKLIGMEGSRKSGRVNSDIYKQLVDKIEIIISKEVGEVPDIPKTEQGGRDFTNVGGYFSEKKNEYSPVANKIYRRLIRFVKYELKQPYMNSAEIDKDQLLNPSWKDSNGDNYGCPSITMNAEIIPVMDGNYLGSTALRIRERYPMPFS
jgi:hypothetical protein